VNWPSKKRMREKDSGYSTGGPDETVALGDPASRCPGAGEAEA